jgi:hypothetical protein
MTARQLVDWNSLNDVQRRENAPTPPSAERHPDGHLFRYAQQQLATIRGASGQERDLALYDLFDQLSRSLQGMSPTWIRAYQRIAVSYLNSGLGPLGDIACASFLLLTIDA